MPRRHPLHRAREAGLLPGAGALLALVLSSAAALGQETTPLPPLPPAPPEPPTAPPSPPPPSAGGATTGVVAPPVVTVTTPRDTSESGADVTWRFPRCNATETEGNLRTSKGCVGVFGLRGSFVDVSGAPGTRGAGFQFSADSEEYWRKGIFSTRDQYRLALGGGGAGVEGALLGDVAFGLRAPVTEHQGPVVRAGMQGYLLGNNAFYSSLIELPQLQLGWQWSKGHAVIEAAGTTGVVLTGRFRAGAAQTRDLGTGFAYGGHVSLQVPWVRLSAIAERLPGDDGLDSVDMAMGTACALAAPLAICADARVEQGHALVAGAEPFVRAAYGGLTIGLTGER